MLVGAMCVQQPSSTCPDETVRRGPHKIDEIRAAPPMMAPTGTYFPHPCKLSDSQPKEAFHQLTNLFFSDSLIQLLPECVTRSQLRNLSACADAKGLAREYKGYKGAVA